MPHITRLLLVAVALLLLSCRTSDPLADSVKASWESLKHRKDPCQYPADSYYFDARTDDELRYTYECQLMAGYFVHDACLELQGLARQSSIPALIYALKLYPPTRDARGLRHMVCTTAHCLESLRAVTGQAFSADASEWERWWVAQGHEPIPAPPPPAAK